MLSAKGRTVGSSGLQAKKAHAWPQEKADAGFLKVEEFGRHAGRQALQKGSF